MSEPVGDTILVAAAPEVVWALVSDPERMPEYSPELASVRWLGGATGPSVGARFKGTNRNGMRRWSTTCTVTDVERGHRFGYRVTSVFGLPVSEWSYELEPTGSGCVLRETTVDRRGWLIRVGGGVLTGVYHRAAHNLEGIRATLAAIKATAERGLPPPADGRSSRATD
jgi:uncharacterized protein YndB with AHSA1/START domain